MHDCRTVTVAYKLNYFILVLLYTNNQQDNVHRNHNIISSSIMYYHSMITLESGTVSREYSQKNIFTKAIKNKIIHQIRNR